MDDFTIADNYLDAGHGDKAMPIFHRLAEQGRLSAMHSIAHTYLYGIAGIKQDYDKAFQWFTRAAAGGCPQAMYHLGLCNAEGYGTPKNPPLAVEWYKKSAAHGDEDAAYRVGDCYERGFGVDQNRDEAIMWYQKAARQGQPEAQERLTRLQ
jgi:FOG: TPR repeat, SEL1 subfamily